MYEKILVALDATAADQTILEHVTKLALTFQSSLVLLHVADGWAARLFGAEAVSPEIQRDEAYLESVRSRLAAAGIQVEADLLYGSTADNVRHHVAVPVLMLKTRKSSASCN